MLRETLHRLRVYLDTSVIGGVFDEEFAEDSRRLFEAIRAWTRCASYLRDDHG